VVTLTVNILSFVTKLPVLFIPAMRRSFHMRVSGLRSAVITLYAESSTHFVYDNHPIANINDHVVRIATMTEPYHWHFHPNSDETFLVIEGRLCIEFESGSRELDPGQLLTIPPGVRHRTRPVSAIGEPHLRVGAVSNHCSLMNRK
jgi:mannose-6-phosphate isomerase-like protein (cupin superfamily)